MQKPLFIPKLVVVGVGLIGGSFALGLKAAGLVGEVVGVGRSRTNLDEALRLGVIDRDAELQTAVQNATMVMLAVPVGQMPAMMQAMKDHLPAGCVVTDAGSTKGDILGYARAYLPDHLPWFVPAHPIAGAEHSGAAAAKKDLYQGKNIVLTPLAENTPEAIGLVQQAWQACGACLSTMTAEAHDGIFATVSHLPHVLAFALVDMVANRVNQDVLFDFAASGFRDFTRIASSHPDMWRDIVLANREALLHEITDYQGQLARIHDLLANHDGAALGALFEHARLARSEWLAGRK